MKTSTAELSHARFTAPRRRAESPRFGVAVALALLRAYKVVISPYFSGSCRFLPSCADYAHEALVRHGLLKGGWLALTRLGRCHPFCAGGHDPVPVSPQDR